MVFSRMGCVSIRAHLRSLTQVYRIFLVRVIHFSFSFIFFLLVISEAFTLGGSVELRCFYLCDFTFLFRIYSSFEGDGFGFASPHALFLLLAIEFDFWIFLRFSSWPHIFPLVSFIEKWFPCLSFAPRFLVPHPFLCCSVAWHL